MVRKVLIIGSGLLTEKVAIELLEEKGIEAVSLDAIIDESYNIGCEKRFEIKDDLLIDNRLFTPPENRAERRKKKRGKNKFK